MCSHNDALLEEYLSNIINVSHTPEQRLLSFPAFWTQMIEISGFPDRFWMFAKNPEYCGTSLFFSLVFFLVCSFRLPHPVTGKEYCTHTLGYLCKNLSVVTVMKKRKIKVHNGFLFTSYSSLHLPVSRGKIHMTGFTSAVWPAAAPRSRQARPAVQQA